MTLTQKDLDAIEHWWKPSGRIRPFLAQDVATPAMVINHLLKLVKEQAEMVRNYQAAVEESDE